MRTIVAVLTMVFLSGCVVDTMGGHTTVAPQRVPKIEKPPKPTLEKMTADELASYQKLPDTAKQKLEENNDKLMVWSQQMSVAIDAYNMFADMVNQAAAAYAHDPKSNNPQSTSEPAPKPSQ